MESKINQTIFDVPKMDCPSEERIVRMALDGSSNIKNLEFDLDNHKLTVAHEGTAEDVLGKLQPLNFGATIEGTRPLSDDDAVLLEQVSGGALDEEGGVLKKILLLNAAMFFFELIFGWIAESTGLIADSLDMLADAAVYGLSLYAVGRSLDLKKRAARFSGIMQFALAAGALFEVVRRFFYGSEPQGQIMVLIALVALLVNVTCLFLLAKHRQGEVHMKASWIFSTNDVLANIGVILAGVLVAIFQSPYPDLIIGFLIALLVGSGAVRIIRLSLIKNDSK